VVSVAVGARAVPPLARQGAGDACLRGGPKAQLEVADVLPNRRPCDGPWPELPARRLPPVVALLETAPSPTCDTGASGLGPHDTTTVIGIIPGGVS